MSTLSAKEYRNIRSETKKNVLAWLQQDGVRFIHYIFKKKPANPADSYHDPSFNMLWHDVDTTRDPQLKQTDTQKKQPDLNVSAYKLVTLTRTFDTSDCENCNIGTIHLYSDNGLSPHVADYAESTQLRSVQELSDTIKALIKARSVTHITSSLGTPYVGECFVPDQKGNITFSGKRIKFAYAEQTEHGPIPIEPYYFDLGGVISITLKLLGAQHRLIIDYGNLGIVDAETIYASDPQDNSLIFLLPKIAPKKP